MKLILMAFVLVLSNISFAQSTGTSTTTLKPSRSNSLVKPWTLEFLIASEQVKTMRYKKVDGVFTKMDASLLQGLTSNDELRYFLASRYLTSELSDEKEFDWYFTEFMYRRKNILTYDKHNIYMEFEFKNLYYLDPEIRDQYGMNGSTIPQVILKQKMGRYGSIELKLRKHFNHTNNNDSLSVDTEDRVYLNLSQMVSRRLILFTQFKYQHKFRKDEGPNYKYMGEVDYMTINRGPMMPPISIPDIDSLPIAKKEQEIVTWHPSVMYLFNRSSMIEFYYETKLGNSYDDRALNEIMQDEQVLGAAVYLTAF